jgi:hypothetical protein
MFGFKSYLLSAVGDGGKKCKVLLLTSLKIFYHCRRQSLKIVNAIT